MRMLLSLAWRRLLVNRRMAAGLLLGFTVAVAAVSSVPAFSAGALQRVLQVDLARQEKRQPAGVIITHMEDVSRPTTAEQYLVADQLARELGPELIGLPLEPFVRYAALDITGARPVDPMKTNPNAERWVVLSTRSDLAEHVTIYDGREARPGKQDGVYEVIAAEAALEAQDLTVGAELWVNLNRSSDSPAVRVNVVGAFRANDPEEPYWFQSAYLDKNLFMPEESFTGSLIHEAEMLPGQYTWYYGIANESVRIDDVSRLTGAIYDLEARLAQKLPDTTLFGGPEDLLSRYVERAGHLQMMMLLLAIPTLAVVGYFVAVTSGLMVEGQRQEIAVLRSRGAGLWQVMAVYLLEGVLLSGLSLVGGYPLGIFLARAMGAVAGFLQFVDRKQPALMLPPDFWLYGLGAAALAVLFYVAPVWPAARQSIISYKQESARKLRRPFWSKWGLDLVMLGLAGYAFYTMRTQPASAAAAGADFRMMEPLNVLAPALLVTGGGLLLLRFLPLLARLAAKIADRWAGAPLYLTLTQISRSPGSYTPVVLLLTLTVGMGLYSAAAARTMERNVADRIAYAGGADVVISEVWEFIMEGGGPGGGEAELKSIQAPPWETHYSLPGVVHPARVRTEEVVLTQGGKSQGKGQLMAIDPPDFGRVAWFRRDLAEAHINEYLNLLSADEEAALVSRAMAERSRLQPGDRITLGADGGELSLVVYGVVDHWPSLYPQDGDFYIANLSYVEDALGLRPYDVWLKMAPGANVQPVVDALMEQRISTLAVHDARQQLIAARRDPQLSGLLGGLTSGFLLAAAITVLGFLLYAALSARSRVLQFGVLRAMGLSSQQLIRAVALEQIIAVGLGVGFGTGLGLTAANLFVPFLQQGQDAASITPPFVIVAEPADRLRLYVVLAVMLIIGLAGLMTALGRLRINEALKLGEDH